MQRTLRTIPRAAAGLIAGALAAFVAPSSAQSHPHVFVETVLALVFDQDRFVAIEAEWKLDEFFSSFLLESFDKDRDRKFDKTELADLKLNAFDTLKAFGYFTQLTANGKAVALDEATEFTAEVLADDTISYRFRLKLKTAVDAKTDKVSLAVYDESYYVELRHDAKTPVVFKNVAAGACTFAIADNPDKTIYFGMIPTQTVRIACAK